MLLTRVPPASQVLLVNGDHKILPNVKLGVVDQKRSFDILLHDVPLLVMVDVLQHFLLVLT